MIKSRPVAVRKQEDYPSIIQQGIRLSARDQAQLSEAYNAELFDMASVFVWSKTIMTLKYQLSRLGMPFIAELLDRPEMDATSNYQDISDYEALKLAEELGFISGTGSFRLKQANEYIKHFTSPEIAAGGGDDGLSKEEAMMVLRSCVQYVLYNNRIEVSVDFKDLRDSLERETLPSDDPNILKLYDSPYYFKRTCLRILLALIQTSDGAVLENLLENANTIIPNIWEDLAAADKYQLGRNYAELINSGNSKATNGLKRILLKVRGFDYVPEDLRSNSFIKAAKAILSAHDGFNNFYNEPLPVQNLYDMGTTIPSSAFGACATALLCVKLGNQYGFSIDAQGPADRIIQKFSADRWELYFNEYFAKDERILYKLISSESIVSRWIDFCRINRFNELRIRDREVSQMLNESHAGRSVAIKGIATTLYKKMGYSQGA